MVECYPPMRKDEAMPSAAMWMDLDVTMLSEVSQKEKGKDTRDATHV